MYTSKPIPAEQWLEIDDGEHQREENGGRSNSSWPLLVSSVLTKTQINWWWSKMEDPQTPHCHQGKELFRKTKQLMMFVKMEIGQNIKESKWRTDDTPFRGFWPLLPFQAITGLKIKLFFSDPFLLFVVYNTQRHSDGCEIQYIGSSVFILLLLGVSLNVIRSISFQIPFLQVLFQLAATSMLGCPALMVSPSK